MGANIRVVSVGDDEVSKVIDELAHFVMSYESDPAQYALLVRGLSPRNSEAFGDMAAASGLRPHDYRDGNSPRTSLPGGVFTATEFNPAAQISMHHELSYTDNFPTFLLFHCRRAADFGGATLLASSTAVTEALDAGVKSRFADGVEYIRTTAPKPGGLLQSWREMLGVESRESAEEVLAAGDVPHHWGADDTLVTTSSMPAFRAIPKLGDIWFNQADQWHPSHYLTDRTRKVLMSLYGTALPHDVHFVDGRPIPDEDVAHILMTTLDCAEPVDWRNGDFLIFNNTSLMHGRAPYGGARDIMVTLGR